MWCAKRTTQAKQIHQFLIDRLLVIGSMVGAGIFTLPAAFGRATDALGALIAWMIAGIGMLMLAFVFQNLAQRPPDLDADGFAAKAGFGNHL